MKLCCCLTSFSFAWYGDAGHGRSAGIIQFQAPGVQEIPVGILQIIRIAMKGIGYGIKDFLRLYTFAFRYLQPAAGV